jgi:type VI secretion system protein ImpA
MASPEVLPIEELAAPIAGDVAVGVDPRADQSPTSVYYAVKDARSQARAAERQLAAAVDEEDAASKRPDWKAVFDNAVELLRSRAKDLEAAAYLIEASARLHGFAGLRDGFQLTYELVHRYWDVLFPLPDEEGVSTRVAPLAGLNGEDAEGTLPQPISTIPITEGRDFGPFSTWHYRQASELDRMADPQAKARRVEQGAVTMDVLLKAVSQTSPEFYRNLLEDVSQCADAFARLSAELDEKCGSVAPPSSNIREAIASCQRTIEAISRDRLAAAGPIDAPSAEGGAPPAEAAGSVYSGGPVRSRDEAFRMLLAVADFFRRTEPHTPVSYALEQVVRWGRMPLPELLTELIPETNTRENLFKMVGITIKNDEGS